MNVEREAWMDADDAFNATLDRPVDNVEKDSTCIVSQVGGYDPHIYGPDDTWTNVWAFEVGERAYCESDMSPKFRIGPPR